MKPILEICNIGKKYRISHRAGGYLSLRERMFDIFRRERQTTEDFWALKDVSFNVEAGESVGIIGRNGAGKSTLLKILSRITPPTTGKVANRGRIASLLEVGTGFHPELTGRENVFLNGSLLGMKRREIESQFDEIVDFSGVEKFLDTPLKHYSSGMQLRLAFAVAAFLEPEILIIDEVLAVGDAEFQRKCMGKMKDVTHSGRTILFVSHDMNAISHLCRRVLVMKQGMIQYDGLPLKALDFYNDSRNLPGFFAHTTGHRKGVYIKAIEVVDAESNGRFRFFHNEEVTLKFDIVINNPDLKCDLFVMILDSQKRRIFATESSQLSSSMQVTIESETLVRGTYSVTAYINQPKIARIDEVDDVCPFEIIDNGSSMLKHGTFDYGSVFARTKWQK